MKKVVNSVLASALALTVAPMAFAAEDTTTAPKMDAAMEKTVKRLEALGLVAGYGNGDFGADKTITRAEFATLIVRARGLEQGAKLAQFNTTYTDVRSTDWFAGFVNVASGEEIVKGFPDKSFKPQNQVTYAEAVTMIVRALGYEPSVRGVWPNSMISKGSELNIAKGINNPNNAAVRGDIFKMLDNALRVKLMEQIEYGTDIRFNVTDETLLTKYLKVTVRDMDWAHEKGNNSDELPLVTNVPAIGLGSLKANEVTLNGKDADLGSNTTYKVAEGINPNAFDGQKVQVWIKDDRENVIVWMEGSEDEDVVMDRVSALYLKGKAFTDDIVKDLSKSDLDDVKIEMDGSEKSYRLTEDTKITYNFTRFNDPVDALSKIYKDNDTFGVKVVLNDNNEVAYLHIIDDQTIDKSVKGVKYGSKVISKIDADKKKITNLDNSKFSDLEDQDEGKDFLVFLDGQPAKLGDLKESDVYSVYYADGDKDKYLVFANRNVAEGKVEKVVSRNKTDIRLTVGGKTYKVYPDASYSENANKDVKKVNSDLDLISNLDGEEVKLLLDPSGRVRHIETKDAIDDRKPLAIITKGATYNSSKDTYDFTVMTQKGKTQIVSLDQKDIYDRYGVNYDKSNDKREAFEKDLVELLQPKVVKEDSATDANQTVLLEVNFDSKGEVDKVKVLDSKLKYSEKSTWDKLADEDDDVVGDYEVTDKTAVFKMTGDLTPATGTKRGELKNAGTAKFKDVAKKSDLKVWYSVDEDKGEVQAIFVVDGSGLGGDHQFGMVKQYGTASKQDTITIVTKDGDSVTEKEYKLDGDADDLKVDQDIRRGDVISFTLNSDGEVIVDDVVEVVNNNHIDNTASKSATLMPEDEREKAGIDKLVVARVDEVDGNTISFNYADGKTQKYYTKASTAFIDVYDGLEGIDGVDEGDYIVMIDSADIDGTRFDYVLVVSSDDEIRTQHISTKAVTDFLKQSQPDYVPNPGDGEEVVTAPKVNTVNDEAVVDGIVTLPADASVRNFNIAFDQEINSKDATVTVTNEDTLGNVTVSEVATDAKVLSFKTAKLDTTKTYIITVKGLKDKNGKAVKDVTLYVEFVAGV
ncbi:S-layer homology domain-containing protein [Brevibacillus choshinensis]|uniref:S-layer homology domain-containing protein n=1 Tax=Brevibacillus choshinensis TaxID=54911 RepID=A0ABX7FYH5_BRECH|nr:S-layer homology domain-containing protein [Brevibacillus choshinensis]QRG70823.1 S-layer homology domain-containing protein [Brevibacillus choshinensis]